MNEKEREEFRHRQEEEEREARERRDAIEQSSVNRAPAGTALINNPFAILSCSIRDKAAQILEAADSRSLVLDERICQTAKNTLTNARLRLAAEMSWLPGVAPGRAEDLVSRAERGMPVILKVTGALPNLAACNLLVTAIEATAKYHPDETLFSELLIALSYRHESIDLDSEIRAINEDRAVSGFPQVSIGGSEALDECRNQWQQRLRVSLGRSLAGLKGLSEAVENITKFFKEPVTGFLSEIVNGLRVDLQPELDRLQATSSRLAASMKERVIAFGGRYDDINDDLGAIASTISAWHDLTGAMQGQVRSQGTDDALTYRFATEVRDLCIFLANEHQIFSVAWELTLLVAFLLPGIGLLHETIEQEKETLFKLMEGQKDAKKKESDEIASFAFDEKIGNQRLVIDATKITFGSKSIKLKEVTRVRYGVFKRYLNGIRTGRNYTVWVGDAHQLIEIECVTAFTSDSKVEALYETVTDKIWAAVCTRLVHETVVGLIEGRKYKFKDAIVDRTGITLTRRRFWKHDEPVHCTWTNLTTGTGQGFWQVTSSTDKNACLKMTFREDDNTHIIAGILRFLWKDGNHEKLAKGTLFQ